MNDDIELRLRAALHEGLDDDPVAVRSLLDGARAGAVRIRRRRTVAAAGVAALLVASAPFGVEIFTGPSGAAPFASGEASGGGSATATQAPSQAATALTAPVPTESDAAVPEPTAEPPTAAVAAGPDVAPVLFPDDVALQVEDFERPVELGLDLGNYANIPPVAGQSCDVGSNPERPLPVSGRTWSWDDAASDRMDQFAVTLSVTGWADASEALTDVRRDTGHCTFLDDVTDEPSAGLPGDEQWAGSSAERSLMSGYGVVRLGAVLVAVSVTHPDGQAAATEEAKRLVTVAAQRTSDALG